MTKQELEKRVKILEKKIKTLTKLIEMCGDVISAQ